MNIKALTRNLIRSGLVGKRPPAGTTGYPPGTLFEEIGTGSLFRNIGQKNYSLFTDFWSNRYELEERFKKCPALKAVIDPGTAVGGSFDQTALQALFDLVDSRAYANPDFAIIGTNAVSSCAVLAAGGGVKLTTTTGSADSVIIYPSLSNKQSAWATTGMWNTALNLSFDCVVKTGATASMATQKIWAGFKKTNTPVTITDTDQAFFRFSSDTEATSAQAASGTTGVHTPAVWECIDSATNVDTIQSSGVAVAIDTTYWLRIQVVNLIPYYFINGVLVKIGRALTTNVALIPYIGIGNLTTSARVLIVRGLRCSLGMSAVSLA